MNEATLFWSTTSILALNLSQYNDSSSVQGITAHPYHKVLFIFWGAFGFKNKESFYSQ